MTRGEEVSSDDCLDLARSLRSSLEFFGLPLPPPESDLDKAIHDLEWMGSFSGAPLRDNGAIQADKTRAIWAFLRFEQLRRIARSLESCRGVPGAGAPDRKLKQTLRSRFDRFATQAAPAQDLLLEFEIAGLLHRSGMTIRMEEPDLVVELAGREIGIACKRPRKPVRLPEHILGAGRQLRRAGLQGIVVVSVESIVYATGDEDRPTYAMFTNSPAEMEAKIGSLVDELLGSALVEVSRRIAEEVIGVMFCVMGTAFCRPLEDGESRGRDWTYSYKWIVRRAPLLGPQFDLSVFDSIDRALRGRRHG